LYAKYFTIRRVKDEKNRICSRLISVLLVIGFVFVGCASGPAGSKAVQANEGFVNDRRFDRR
jgi:hypothetical protein